MILVDLESRRLLDDLVATLDADIQLLRDRLTQLARLSEMLLPVGAKAAGGPAADHEAEMEQVLAEMEQAQARQEALDQRLDGIRRRLAQRMGCSQRELTLGRLAEGGEGADRLRLHQRRALLVQLTRQVRRENQRASMLLAQSARINRLILERLWPEGQAITTYNPSGAQDWRPESGLFEARL